ncbi:hypothetical protein [Shouchella clausii]|uniref:hypothetical protein n=1 Tax=Shouchella clausii TaxID=79880 RepID=UPI000BA53EA7|nr:hypothetical protein [Shouchella clausii]PAE96831.1 hypothetical protein CHH70_00450 [Shouchella clausii]
MSRQIGDKHVLAVSRCLKKLIKGIRDESNELAFETASFILKEVANSTDIITVKSKFDMEVPDKSPDLELILKNGNKRKINLFLVKGNGQIQIKNPGARSVFSTYFLSENMQLKFNEFMDVNYKNYLEELLFSANIDSKIYTNVSEMRKEVKNIYPKFTDDINPSRERFLNSLREFSYELLKNAYNESGQKDIKYAFNALLLLEDINIITRYKEKIKNECSGVSFFNPQIDESYPVKIFKKGQNKVGIRIGSLGLSLRFKFESSPASSIKLVSSAENFINDKENRRLNINNVHSFEKLINKHKKKVELSNMSNAVGKCHEAIFYYIFLKKNLDISQVDEKVFQKMFAKYSPALSEKQIYWLINSVESSYKKLIEFLCGKYVEFVFDSVQLVPDSYISDPLDASDMKIIMTVAGKYVTESISLKALRRVQKSTTVKNAGMGTILGPQYFDIGDLKNEINDSKAKYLANKKTHMEILQSMSSKIGDALEQAPQEKLLKGIQSMLGNCTLVITFYEANKGVVLQHGNINGKIKVFKSKPSLIQNTLTWNNDTEQLSIRAKFSKGKSYGWSPLKLACNYQIEI